MKISIRVVLIMLLLFFLIPVRNIFANQEVGSILFSADSTLLGARISKDGQWRFKESGEVPYKFAKAIVCYEDKRFYRHLGIDLIAVGRAMRQNIINRRVVSGASTITMQTIRLAGNRGQRTLWRKMYEALLAVRLECRYSKSHILSLYCANAPFGGNVVGLEAAAWRYFGCKANELSWAESAMLSVLPNAPSLTHLGKNRALLLEKRNALLHKLYSNGLLTEDELELSLQEELPLEPKPMPDMAHHYLEYLRSSLGSGRFYTNIDYALQRAVNSIAERYNRLYRLNYVNNIAIVVKDVASNEIVAYVGNAPMVSTENYYVDVARARRSSASTLKPFLYSAMLDNGSLYPNMLVKDYPFRFKNFNPKNFDNTFRGAVPAREVIERSLNVPAVGMLDVYGIERFRLLLRSIGLKTIDRPSSDYGLSLVLGGAEVTLVDLVNAYTMAAHTLRFGSKFPLGRASLYLTFNALADATRPEEESLWEEFVGAQKIAWKTGTSWGNRDAWCVGVTPSYVVGVWVGNATGEGRSAVSGVRSAAPVMFDVFSYLPHSDWFECPVEEMQEVSVCALSGYPSSEACSEVRTELVPIVRKSEFSTETVQPTKCPYHSYIYLSKDSLYRVDDSCASLAEMVKVSWFSLPPAMEWYYMRSNPSYKTLPPLHPLSKAQSNRLQILYPTPGTVVVMPLGLDGTRQSAVLRAAHNNPSAVLYWHLDGELIGETSGGDHSLSLVAEPGTHTLVVMDAFGNRTSVRFKVK